MRFLLPKTIGLGLVIAIQLAGAARAEEAAQSQWPCIQRKVPEISPAAVWSGPPLESAAARWRGDPEIVTLVERLAARRTPLEEAERTIAAFAQSTPESRQEKLMKVMAGLIETLNSERAEVIAGIERYAAKQLQLAEKLRRDRATLDSLQNDPAADPDKVLQASEQLTWDLRIFDERQHSLSFVCEVPVLIEQRLFQLSRAIQQAFD